MDIFSLTLSLNSCIPNATPHGSPVLSRKVKESKGILRNSNGKETSIFSSGFQLRDIELLLNSSNLNISLKNNVYYFSNSSNITFECDESLFLN
jgi:hypothetical protein